MRWLKRYVWCIRFKDVLALQGPPMMGVTFTMREVAPENFFNLLLLLSLASFFLVAHVFCFNDWADITLDLNDPNKAEETFLAKGISQREVGLLSLCLALLSLLLFSLLPGRTLALGVVILLLSLLYSHPIIHVKGIPVASSVIHLIGGLLYFLLGYSLFGGFDHRGWLIALFFALTFSAGHLNQEVRDYEVDRRNGIFTNGVMFGKKPTFYAGFFLFTLCYGYLFFLASSGLVPPQLMYLIILYPVHAVLSWRTLKAGLTFDSVNRFQTRYRLLYAVIGLSMAITVLLSSSGTAS